MTKVGERTDAAYEHKGHVHAPLTHKAIDLRDVSPETQAKLNEFLKGNQK